MTSVPATTTTTPRVILPVSNATNKQQQQQATPASELPPPSMFTPEWFTHGRILLMGGIGLAFVVVLCYGWWWFKANQRLHPFHDHEDTAVVKRSVWFFEHPLLQGRHFALPRGTYDVNTLSLTKFSCIKVPEGVVVELHSITMLVQVPPPATGGAVAATDSAAAATAPQTSPPTTAVDGIAPEGYTVRPAPPIFVCRAGATTDVSYVEWEQVQHIVIRAA